MNIDDGHSPTTCNWRECKANSEYPCPFVSDKIDELVGSEEGEAGHTHRYYIARIKCDCGSTVDL